MIVGESFFFLELVNLLHRRRGMEIYTNEVYCDLFIHLLYCNNLININLEKCNGEYNNEKFVPLYETYLDESNLSNPILYENIYKFYLSTFHTFPRIIIQKPNKIDTLIIHTIVLSHALSKYKFHSKQRLFHISSRSNPNIRSPCTTRARALSTYPSYRNTNSLSKQPISPLSSQTIRNQTRIYHNANPPSPTKDPEVSLKSSKGGNRRHKIPRNYLLGVSQQHPARDRSKSTLPALPPHGWNPRGSLKRSLGRGKTAKPWRKLSWWWIRCVTEFLVVRVPAEARGSIRNSSQLQWVSAFSPTIPFRSWKAAKNLEREKGGGHLLDLPDDPDLKAS